MPTLDTSFHNSLSLQTSEPNSFHLFQTAERIRQVHPDKGILIHTSFDMCMHACTWTYSRVYTQWIVVHRCLEFLSVSWITIECTLPPFSPILTYADWLQVTGLIHDVGKLLAIWGEPQWSAVGDTFPVGCAFSEKCVFHETFENNPDHTHPVYRLETFLTCYILHIYRNVTDIHTNIHYPRAWSIILSLL